MDAGMSPRVRKDMEETYRTAKSRFVGTIKNKRRRAKLLHPISKANATKINKANITIDEIDELTWDQLSKLTLLSTAKRYPAMEPVIEKLLKEGILDREYNQRQAAELLRRELTRKLGATALKGVDREVIAAGQESNTAFFKGLTQTNMNYAENFANVTAMDEAQIDRYVITAIIDNLTSDICLQMDGRTFEVVRAVEYRDRILAAESVEEVKGVAPWRKDLSEFGLKKGEKLTDAKTSDALAQAGLALPPYHFRCRTLVFPA